MSTPEERFAREEASAAALESLSAASAASNATMTSLVEGLKKETEARDRRLVGLEKSTKQMRNFTVIVCLAVLFLLIIAAINATNIAATRKQNDQTARIAADVDQTNKNMLDCINETGECGKQDAQRQRELLDEVKLYELTGFYCIRNNPATADPRGQAFLDCMQRLYPGGPTLDLGDS